MADQTSFLINIGLGSLPELGRKIDPEIYSECAKLRSAIRNVAGNFSSFGIGSVLGFYTITTSVASASFVANAGTAINDTSTFDGYTLQQVVRALRELKILT